MISTQMAALMRATSTKLGRTGRYRLRWRHRHKACPSLGLDFKLRRTRYKAAPASASNSGLPARVKLRRRHRPTQDNCHPGIFFRFFPCILRSDSMKEVSAEK